MKLTQDKQQRRAVRHRRLRARVMGTATRPRLAVFRSNTAVYAQLINDETQRTIAAADSRKLTDGTLQEKAAVVGTNIADAAKQANITEVVFDRGGFRYQGIVAAVAAGARDGGLTF